MKIPAACRQPPKQRRVVDQALGDQMDDFALALHDTEHAEQAGRQQLAPLPLGEIHANTTMHLIDDIEHLRRHLGIPRWWVSGGSWGATLALAYAAAHPQVVDGVVVRSVFMPGDGNVRWFFEGLAALRPEAWRALSAALGDAPDLLAELAVRLGSADREAAGAAALAWLRYEQAVNDPAV